MKKEFIECDQCKKAFDYSQLRSTREDGCRLKFMVTHLWEDTGVRRYDVCSAKCLEEFSKTIKEQ